MNQHSTMYTRRRAITSQVDPHIAKTTMLHSGNYSSMCFLNLLSGVVFSDLLSHWVIPHTLSKMHASGVNRLTNAIQCSDKSASL